MTFVRDVLADHIDSFSYLGQSRYLCAMSYATSGNNVVYGATLLPV